MRALSVILLVAMTIPAAWYQHSEAGETKSLFVDLYAGEPVTMDTVIDDLSSVRLVYLGEIHTIVRHHMFQSEILGKLSERGVKPALAMEMFSEDQQGIVDQWLKGKGDVASLMKSLGKERWSNLQDYEPLLLRARASGIPVVAINAPDKLVRRVARNGMDGLTDEEKGRIPPGTQNINPLNDKLLRLRLKVHRAFQDKALDNIVLAQAVRDETMARAVTGHLEGPTGKDSLMVIIAGSGHLNYGFGIPERTFRLNELPYRIILPTESGQLVLSEEEEKQAVPTHVSHSDLKFITSPIADYLYVLPLAEEKHDSTLEYHAKQGESKSGEQP